MKEKVSIFAPNGSKFRTLLYVGIFSLLNKFYIAYTLSYTNTAVDHFKAYIHDSYVGRGIPLSAGTEIWLWSLILNCIFAGDVVGTMITPLFTERLGRKATSLIANIFCAVATLICAFAIPLNLPEMFLLNFRAYTLLLLECPPASLRGICYFIAGTAFRADALIGMILGMSVVLGNNLFVLVGLAVIPVLLTCLLIMTLKETPKYLLMNKRNKEKALASLKFYQGKDASLNAILEEDDINCVGKSGWTTLKEVFTQAHLRRAVCLGVCAIQLCIGILPFTTELLEAHYTPNMAETLSSILLGANSMAGLIGIYVVSRISMRRLMIGSGGANIASLVFYVIFDRAAAMFPSPIFTHGCFVSMLCYYVSNGIGFGSISFYISGELLPQMHRAIGQSVCFTVALSLMFGLSLVSLPTYEFFGVWVFMPLFIVPNTLALLFLYAYLPETKDKEIEEIVEEIKEMCKK
ncbi:sugar transporter domain-containing protein [Ditylenchus destructor]|nr:sugar transporter domain-containing protein [Ditylenchus destructor]